eukprot:2824212-Amphidinium_carterae.1
MDQSEQSMLLITLGVIPLTAFIAVGVSQNVMSEISQIVKSVIRFGIRVSTIRNQIKVRSLSMSLNEIKSRNEPARKFSMAAEPASMQSDSTSRTTSRTSYLKSSRESAVSSSPGQIKTCCSCQLRNQDSLTYSDACRPYVSPSPMQTSFVDIHWKQCQRDSSLSKVILHRLLPMTEGESHALIVLVDQFKQLCG